jgi:hypothetical protein
MTIYIDAYSPTGNNRRITLLGTDLIFGGIDNVFVYPSLDVDRLQDALSRTLSFWPILTGRILVDDDQYFVEFSDNSIPFTIVENDQLERWPDLPVLVDDMTMLQPFIDSIQYKPQIEPLLRFKVTHLLQSGEYILGTSFSHTIGDADSNMHFLNDLSRIYQHQEPLLPLPTFERCLLNEEDPEFALLPVMKLSRNAAKREVILARLGKEQTETDAINLSFSSEQLAQLRIRAGDDDEVTIHDVLCAYIIVIMNKTVCLTPDEYIRRAHLLVNCRGVSDSLAPKGQVANSIIQTLSSNFPDPHSLSAIAKTIRQAIKTTRNEDFLGKWIGTTDALRRQVTKDGRVSFLWDADEVVFNSNFKYDWTSQVDFGMTNQCRLHTIGMYKFYFRIFQLNPVRREDGSWAKDNGGAEVAFRIPKGEKKENFLEAWKKDVEENFVNL